jgi:hypothetical protein
VFRSYIFENIHSNIFQQKKKTREYRSCTIINISSRNAVKRDVHGSKIT